MAIPIMWVHVGTLLDEVVGNQGQAGDPDSRGGGALDEACEQQLGQPRGDCEQQHGGQLARPAGQQVPAAADPVAEDAEQRGRQQDANRVGAEGNRDGPLVADMRGGGRGGD
jgi:hypothetical protein